MPNERLPAGIESPEDIFHVALLCREFRDLAEKVHVVVAAAREARQRASELRAAARALRSTAGATGHTPSPPGGVLSQRQIAALQEAHIRASILLGVDLLQFASPN